MIAREKGVRMVPLPALTCFAEDFVFDDIEDLSPLLLDLPWLPYIEDLLCEVEILVGLPTPWTIQVPHEDYPVSFILGMDRTDVPE